MPLRGLSFIGNADETPEKQNAWRKISQPEKCQEGNSNVQQKKSRFFWRRLFSEKPSLLGMISLPAIQGHRQALNYGFSLPGLQVWVYALIFLRPIWLCVNRNVFNIGIFSSSKNRVIYWLYWSQSCLYWQECNLSHWSPLRGSSKVLVEAKIFDGLPEALLYLPTMSLIKDCIPK